jgi:hypothetical protein
MCLHDILIFMKKKTQYQVREGKMKLNIQEIGISLLVDYEQEWRRYALVEGRGDDAQVESDHAHRKLS